MITALLRLPSVLGFTLGFVLVALGTTFLMAVVSTIVFPIRHDLITLSVGLPSAVVAVVKGGVFSPLVFVVFITVPHIGSAVGRDMRKRKDRKTNQQVERTG